MKEKQRPASKTAMAATKQDARFRTDIGLDIKSLYTPSDLDEAGFDYDADLNMPGRYPFTRGIVEDMYRSDLWIRRAYSGFGEPSICNERYKKVVAWGADEIVIAADLPTQLGYDSDHIMATGEVGKVGVAIDTLHDMEILFQDIPLNQLRRVSILGNSIAPIALSLFIALGEKQGLDVSDFVVDLQNDVLKEYVARGTYIFPIRPSVRMTTDVIGYCVRHIPNWFPCTLCANHLNAAGAGSTKAAAFALANGICYINELLQKGFKIDEVAPYFMAFLDERADFFVAISNIRATRKVWARLMRDHLKAVKTDSMALKVTAYSHGGETLREPVNNIVRIALAALAYVFGGVNSLYNASYDEVMGPPSEEAAKIALRTQQILAYELGITKTADPLGGSYYIESLTSRIEKEIYNEVQKVEAMGGAIAAIEKGYCRRIISEGAIRRQKAFDSREKTVVGVNKFRTDEEVRPGAFRVDPGIEKRQVERLQMVKAQRNQKAVKDALAFVREKAVGSDNLVPAVLEAVRAYATIGEICNVFKEVFGEYQVREYFSPGNQGGKS